jgi:hypothetical protein
MYLFNTEDCFVKYGQNYLIDRTQTLKDHPEIYFYRKIGTNSLISFRDVALKRASELKRISEIKNKKLFLFWSGGIDSTVALFSLLEVGAQNLIVSFTKESISEYQLCFDKYVKSLTNVLFKPEDTSDLILKNLHDCLFVTGEIGDQIFGSNLFITVNPQVLNKEWSYVVNKKIFSETEIFVSKCPVKIKTVKQFLWWINYALRYQLVSCKFPLAVKELSLDKNLFNFFDSDDWNNWAVSTDMEEKFLGEKLRNYKMIAKEFIYNFTKDNDYKNNKLKEQRVRLNCPEFVRLKIAVKGEGL